MSGAHTQWWQELRSGYRVLQGQQRGQSLVIVTFAFIGILAFVGLAIDLGWVYVERVRVAQAADAAALAGASDLPLEGGAHTRALVYLQENGYDYTDVGNVQLFINDPEHPPAEDVHTNIWIDTDYSRDTSLPVPQQVDTADRIRVRVRRDVFMTFMQFIGFRYVSVEATAEAENISNIDTAIVYDRSGSMEFDTLCYGCWEPSEEQQYPSGHLYPLPWSDSTIESADHCAADDRYHEQGGEIYVVIEAEDYSRLSADYHDWGYTPYYSFWVLQRNDYNDSWNDSVGAMGRDSRGAYLSHHPFSNYEYTTGLGVSCTWYDLTHGEYCRSGLPAGGPYSAPRADYDFYAPSEGLYYFHLRGQGGNFDDDDYIFWGVDGTVQGRESGFYRGPYYDGAVSSRWSWHRLGKGEWGNQGDTVWLAEGDHTLHLWAGGAGFDVDRVIISTDSSPGSAERTLAPNDGRTGWACEVCDPRYAGRPGGHEWTEEEPYYRPDCNVGGNPDQRNDAIYDDEQPIRNALEAAKHFVGRLNPRFDQVGYVRYSTTAEIARELECLRRLGADNCTPDVITDTVLYELDTTYASGNTNIAQGLEQGIAVLSTASPHYGRPGAAHVMVLMTDGQPNRYPDYPNYHECWQEDLWPDTGDTATDRAADCVIHYAQEARDNAIVIYTISLGESADRMLMEEVAGLTGGFHRGADSRDELDAIFDELFGRIFLRLIH